MIKLVYIAIVGAIYLYNAYQSNQKKRQSELKKQQQVLPETDTKAQPVYETRKPTPDLFKEMFGGQAPAKSRPMVQQRQQPKKQPIKQVSKTKYVTEESIVEK